jgi:hypothetical protein
MVNGFIQFRLPPPNNKHMSALFRESLCRGEADAAATACYDGCPVLQFVHDVFLLLSTVWECSIDTSPVS